MPSCERKGSVAQVGYQEILLIIIFMQNRTVVETVTGLPVVTMPKIIYDTVPRIGIDGTIAVGTFNGEKIVLCDVISIEGNSVKMKAWEERLEILKKLCDGFTTEGARVFIRSSVWTRGLMKVYSDLKAENSEARLLLRIPGETAVSIC